MITRFYFLTGAATLAVLSSDLSVQIAEAQTAAPSGAIVESEAEATPSSGGELVVTARRRTEAVQNIPLAVAVIDARAHATDHLRFQPGGRINYDRKKGSYMATVTNSQTNVIRGYLANASKARVRGIEAEARFDPARDVNLAT